MMPPIMLGPPAGAPAAAGAVAPGLAVAGLCYRHEESGEARQKRVWKKPPKFKVSGIGQNSLGGRWGELLFQTLWFSPKASLPVLSQRRDTSKVQTHQADSFVR